MMRLLLLACLACVCSARSLAARDDYEGLVPTLGGSLSCLDAALLAQALDCQEVSTSSARVSLERCSSGGGGGAGLFVMCSKRRCRQGWEAGNLQNDTAPGQDVFRVRLVGPEVHLLDILYCGADLAFAQYSLAEPGAYHAEVLHLNAFAHTTPPQGLALFPSALLDRRMPAARVKPPSVTAPSAQVLHLYENFTYAAHPPMIRDYQLSAATFEVRAGEAGILAHSAAAATPSCSRGRWVLGEEYRCNSAQAVCQTFLLVSDAISCLHGAALRSEDLAAECGCWQLHAESCHSAGAPSSRGDCILLVQGAQAVLCHLHTEKC